MTVGTPPAKPETRGVEHDFAGIEPITDAEFALFQAYVHRVAGIFLAPSKKALLMGRLRRRLKSLGFSNHGDYYRHLINNRAEEEVGFLDCICTNETHFFREKRHFEFLEEVVFRDWLAAAADGRRPPRVRAWSAGCSTGEEVYSLAMAMSHHLQPAAAWQLELVGTDLSARALASARKATWPLQQSEEIPAHYLRQSMLRGIRSEEGLMRAGPEIRSLVRFERLNLNDAFYSIRGPFDLIFCRNVLIYFSSESRLRVVNRLFDMLLPGGYLFLGHAESLGILGGDIRNVIPNVYMRVPAS